MDKKEAKSKQAEFPAAIKIKPPTDPEPPTPGAQSTFEKKIEKIKFE